MNANTTNVNFLLGVALLTSSVIDTSFTITKIMFEDGSGRKFTGTLWNRKDKVNCNFFFQVNDGIIIDFNVWIEKAKEASCG